MKMVGSNYELVRMGLSNRPTIL